MTPIAWLLPCVIWEYNRHFLHLCHLPMHRWALSLHCQALMGCWTWITSSKCKPSYSHCALLLPHTSLAVTPPKPHISYASALCTIALFHTLKLLPTLHASAKSIKEKGGSNWINKKTKKNSLHIRTSQHSQIGPEVLTLCTAAKESTAWQAPFLKSPQLPSGFP